MEHMANIPDELSSPPLLNAAFGKIYIQKHQSA